MLSQPPAPKVARMLTEAVRFREDGCDGQINRWRHRDPSGDQIEGGTPPRIERAALRSASLGEVGAPICPQRTNRS